MKELDIFMNVPEGASPEELEKYLDLMCGDDIEKRKGVEALIAAGLEAETMFQVNEPLEALLGRSETRPVAPFVLADDLVGSVFGDFRLLEKIGEGGMGSVYLADQLKGLKRRVAVKILQRGMDSELVARFEVERQALALMKHPNIATVYDSGTTASGLPYFVMEYVQGVSITEFCDESNLSTTERLELFTSVCNAAQHAHQKGIIHRDLKPSNVMVTLHDDSPVVKVIDFGVAKTQLQLTEKTLYTRLGEMVGTPAYMSPEQAELKGNDIDTRSDIYSLGVLLYELLTGRPPFDPKSLQAAGFDEIRRVIREDTPLKPSTRLSKLGDAELSDLAKHRKAEPRKLSALVSGDLDWIVMKALDKDRTRRYETAAGFAQDIHRCLAGQPVLAVAPTTSYRLRKFLSRHRAPVAVAATIMVLVVAGVLGTLLFALESNRNRIDAERAEGETKAAFKKFRFAESVGKLQLLPVTKTAGRKSLAVEAIREAAEIDPSAAVRDLAIRNLTLPDIKPAPTELLGAFPAGSRELIFSPMLDRYAFCDARGSISIRDPESGTELMELPKAIEGVERLDFDPRGELLAIYSRVGVGDGAVLKVWDLGKDAIVFDRPVSGQSGAVVDLSADGNWIVYGVGGKAIEVRNLRDPERVFSHTLADAPRRIHFQPTGHRLAIESHESLNLTFLSWRTGDISTVHFPDLLNDVAWHPRGDLICVAPIGSPLALCSENPDGSFGDPISLGQGTIGVNQLAYSAGGSFIVTTDANHLLKLWDASTGREIVEYPIAAGEVFAQLQVSPDDRSLAWSRSGSTVKLWGIEPESAVYTLSSRSNLARRATQPSFDSTGRVLFLTSDTGVRLWDWRNRRNLGVVEIGPVHSVAWNQQAADLVMAGARGGMRVHLDLAGDILKSGTLRLFDAPPPLAGEMSLGGSGGLVAFSEPGAVRTFAPEDFLGGRIELDDSSPVAVAVHPGKAEVAVIDGSKELLRIFSADGGSTLAEFPLSAGESLCFSPDGKLLIASHEAGYQFYSTADWKPGQLFAGPAELGEAPIAIAPGSRFAAWNASSTQVAIVSLEEMRVVAHLPLRGNEPATGLAFSPSGRELAVAGKDQRAEVWDLSALNLQLSGFGLNWKSAVGGDPVQTPPITWVGRGNIFELRARSYFEEQEQVLAADPSRSAEERGQAYHRLSEYGKAAGEFAKASELQPDSPHLIEWRADRLLRQNFVAEAISELERALQIDSDYKDVILALTRIYLMGPDEFRDDTAGKEFCEKLDELGTGERESTRYVELTCHAANQFRQKKFRESRVLLEQAIAIGKPKNYSMTAVYYLKAMCLHHESRVRASAGEVDEARENLHAAERIFAEANRRGAKNPVISETHPLIVQLRHEASELLGHPIPGKITP